MKTIKEYEDMPTLEQENFLAHAGADLAQAMYYGNDSKGLEILIKNLTAVADHARNCLDCLEILRREGNVYMKIYLLLDYMCKNGVNEELVSSLEEITELAQESLALNNGTLPTEEERKVMMKRLRTVLDRNDNHEVSEGVKPEKKDETAMTNANPAKGKVASAEASISETAVAV